MKNIQLTESVFEKLEELSKEQQFDLIQVMDNISLDPSFATPLKANLQGLYLYQSKKCQMVYQTKDNTITILSLEERPEEQINK